MFVIHARLEDVWSVLEVESVTGGEGGTKMRQVAVLCEGVRERNQDSRATPTN